jgi:acyl-CoA thioester hydrolase
MSAPHIFPIRVYFEDTDAGGMVYHANYLRFMERARTEMLRTLDADHSRMMKDDGAMFVVKSCDVEYHKPARLDDALEVHSSVVETGNASLELQQDVKKDGVLLVSARVRLACTSLAGQPCRIPAAIRGKIV